MFEQRKENETKLFLTNNVRILESTIDIISSTLYAEMFAYSNKRKENNASHASKIDTHELVYDCVRSLLVKLVMPIMNITNMISLANSY